MWNYMQVQFGFYSFPTLIIACEVNTAFIFVVSTWKRPESKYPES